MKRTDFLKFNIFTILMVVASFGFAFRLVDIVTFESKTIKTAQAVEETSNEQPPPITKEDIEKAVKKTAQDVETMMPDAPARKDASLPPITEVDENRAFSPAEIEVLQSLSKRRDELAKREQSMGEREALLNAAEQQVDRKIAELGKLKGEIEKLLGQQETMEESRIASLVKIYEAMKPKEAAIIFNTLDIDVLLSVVSRMNERKISPILASMEPEKARIVTIKLAEMRKLPEASAPVTPARAPVVPAP